MERSPGLIAGAPFWHAGGCHCGRVRIEAFAPADLDILECNCSMCDRSGYLHLIVTANQFRLVAGAGDLVDYRFGTGTARHLFCRHCGVKSFYVPRSHPDGYSVNARCLDPAGIVSMRIRSFDGRHWEAARTELDAHSQGARRASVCAYFAFAPVARYTHVSTTVSGFSERLSIP